MTGIELYKLEKAQTVQKSSVRYRIVELHSTITLMSDHRVYPTLVIEPINNSGKRELLSLYNCEEFQIAKIKERN